MFRVPGGISDILPIQKLFRGMGLCLSKHIYHTRHHLSDILNDREGGQEG